MKPPAIYKKHIYWMTGAEESRLGEKLMARNIKMRTAKGIACTPLDEINRISRVPPDVWDETCARQGSWYRASNKNGLYLIISSFELDGYEAKKYAVITRSGFAPPRLASMEEKNEMINDLESKNVIPPKWLTVEDIEKRIYLRWARRLGSDVEDYDFLYRTHTANHANFIKPRFFINKGTDIIPYSIDRSAHLCSCCLELFQVLGGEYEKKLVAPCPGATIFARLKPDRYLLVERVKNPQSNSSKAV